jgi:hypothetical protein
MEDLNSLLIPYSLCKGDYKAYIEMLYEVFTEDFIESMPNFKGNDVDFTGKRKDDGKEEKFWHVITTGLGYRPKGSITNERNIDIKRAERIRWIREIIENYKDPTIKYWIEKQDNQIRHYLWYGDEFLVVLGQQHAYPHYHLVTAFYVNPTKRPNYQMRCDKCSPKKTMSP